MFWFLVTKVNCHGKEPHLNRKQPNKYGFVISKALKTFMIGSCTSFLKNIKTCVTFEVAVIVLSFTHHNFLSWVLVKLRKNL